MTTARRLLGLLLASVLVLTAACGGDDDAASDDQSGDETTEQGATLRVPEDHDTIQAAVDAAAPGDLILVGPGTYEEAVTVETDELTIRGLDRNEVILDGGFELDNGIRVVGASGVAVENMTARNYTDAGFYIGQCYPCDAVIDGVVSEFNGLGYSGTNSGGNLLIVNSTFRNNRAGVVPNSGTYELCYPERDTTIVGNRVYDNNQSDSPAIEVAFDAQGNGILVAGGVGNTIERNRVWDHDLTGIGLVPFPETDASDVEPPAGNDDLPCSEARELPTADPADIPETVLWNPRDNSVVGNVVEDSRLADIGVGSLVDVSGMNNCFADNEISTTAPADLEALAPCEGEGSGGDWADGALDFTPFLAEKPPSGDYKTSPVPEAQETMPDAESAPARPATDVPPSVDLDAIEVPDKPS